MGDAFALIFLRYVADVAAMGASDFGRDPLRLLSFKVQEGDGSAVFRKHLGRRQSDTLLVSPRLRLPRLDLVVTSLVSFLLYLRVVKWFSDAPKASSSHGRLQRQRVLIVVGGALLNAGGGSRLPLCKDGPPDDILTKDGVLTIDGVR